VRVSDVNDPKQVTASWSASTTSNNNYCGNIANMHFGSCADPTCPLSATTADGGNWAGYPTTLAHKLSEDRFIFVTHVGGNVHMCLVDSHGSALDSKFHGNQNIDVNDPGQVTASWTTAQQYGNYCGSLANMQFGSCE